MALLVLLALAPPRAHAQSAIYTGRLTCGASDDGRVPAATATTLLKAKTTIDNFTFFLNRVGLATF